jgi:hypothetical protein
MRERKQSRCPRCRCQLVAALLTVEARGDAFALGPIYGMCHRFFFAEKLQSAVPEVVCVLAGWTFMCILYKQTCAFRSITVLE